MMLVEMADAASSLRAWVTRARKEPVVLTLKGRPMVALTPIEDGDWENVIVAAHPAFRKLLTRSRQRCKPGQGISTEQMRRRLERRRRGASSAPRVKPSARKA
jgi:hypothetical protein